jgi:hypothetical protein
LLTYLHIQFGLDVPAYALRLAFKVSFSLLLIPPISHPPPIHIVVSVCEPTFRDSSIEQLLVMSSIGGEGFLLDGGTIVFVFVAVVVLGAREK